MAIDPALIKLYQCATWAEGDSHGGAINTATGLITDASANNIFDDVTDAERLAGVLATDSNAYRKVFIRNENADTWAGVKCWISQATDATNDEVHIVAAVGADIASTAKGYTYVTPTSKVHADVLSLGDIVQNASVGIWVQRLVDASGNGYTNNTFKLAFESS